jgi:DNA polymerase III epsilon subunit-like protein
MKRYLSIDCETGGISPETSLLTAFFGLHDEAFSLIDSYYAFIKPDDGIYRVEAQGLQVNKISIPDHDLQAKPPSVIRSELGAFLYRISEQGKEKPIPIGHNVKFDIQRIVGTLIGQKTWDHCVSYRTLDTGPIGQFLKLQGKLPDSVSGSLESYATHFGIEAPGAFHGARTDALVTVMVLVKMLAL